MALFPALASDPAVPQTTERDLVGYGRLAAKLGSGMPDGRSVIACLVEGGGTAPPGQVAPNFIGKDLRFPAGIRTFTDHANMTGTLFFGGYSLAPGLREIDMFTAGTWGENVLLHRGTPLEVSPQRADVESHSWIHDGDTPELDRDILRRIDLMVARDDVLVVTTLSNGKFTVFPGIPSAAHNALTAGVSSGEHSRGGPKTEGAGRLKPEIVVPVDVTSKAAPVVASAGALLIDAARRNPDWKSADASIAARALLLAGADRKPFPAWTRTPDRPIDAVFGAGQLDVFRSYHLLSAGRAPGGKERAFGACGWDCAPMAKPVRFYFFDVTPSDSGEFSAALVWNREIANGLKAPVWGSLQARIPRMELRLYKASGFSVGTPLDSSTQRDAPLQYLRLSRLDPGRYALEITTEDPGTPCAIAWRCAP